MQYHLPFGRKTFAPQHLQWLLWANGIDYPDRKFTFYPFKSRLLRRFGQSDGVDKQVLTYSCYHCNGTGWYRPGEKCRSCTNGVYDIRTVWLHRFLLCGRVFHEPNFYRPDGSRFGDYKELIQGWVYHREYSEMADSVGRRSMDRLMLRYEPMTFLKVWHNRWQGWYSWSVRRPIVVQWQYQIRHVKQLFSKNSDTDEVPF